MTINKVYRIGVDIGGTFTDFALFNEEGGTMVIHKQLTTPADPSVAVLEGVQALLARTSVPIAEIKSVSHGTTLVTNAVIERKGARTGMLVTKGFHDILEMGLEQRYDLFDLRLRFPEPLTPRQLRREIPERILYDGTVEQELDTDAVRTATAELVDQHGIEALAVCFLHSYADRSHEERARELVKDAFPNLYVSTVGRRFSQHAGVRRWTTTTINAYTQPMFDRYLERLEDGLSSLGFAGRLYIMTSSGGSLAPDAARRFPVRALESGPAAGVLMSAHHGHISRAAAHAVLRHGRDDRKRRADQRLCTAEEIRDGSCANARVQARQRSTRESSRHRHDRNRCRRRVHRGGR